MSKRKLRFPDQSSIAKWLIKEKKDIFETLSVPLLDYYTPHNKIVGGYTGFTMSVRPSVDKSYVVR